ncbi:uncharacterized protein LOC133931181 isoform X1 [Phragmites australis]|uniref:uncharacterized protein LOC133931181 isoform X1 n=1 Tax=Phragmites australis TaxID=29695 RepID=UPI002D77ED1B|nr:uncharacterized protein LOC133931181 isoform X1 [Phragmites australis]
MAPPCATAAAAENPLTSPPSPAAAGNPSISPSSPAPAASAVGSEPETSQQQDADARWLETLSETELVRPLPPSPSPNPFFSFFHSVCAFRFQSTGFPSISPFSVSVQDLLISLKELAVTRATNAGHPKLADRFHLRTLRALGIVLLENFKGRLQESTSVNTNMFERLALLSDPDVDVSAHRSNFEPQVVRPSENQPVANGVNRKRKQMQDEPHEEGTLSPKKRRMDEAREE